MSETPVASATGPEHGRGDHRVAHHLRLAERELQRQRGRATHRRALRLWDDLRAHSELTTAQLIPAARILTAGELAVGLELINGRSISVP